MNYDADIKSRVGYFLNDDDETLWTETIRVAWLNDGVKKIRDLIPESRLYDGSYTQRDYELYDPATPKDIILDDIYQQALIYYIVWNCYEMENENENYVMEANKFREYFEREIS